jgi:hypothetical protein
MIDIKELRIGNWIMDKKPFQVYAETFADIESTYTNFQPIPLSPEVLTACGFENGEIFVGYHRYKVENFWTVRQGKFDGIYSITILDHLPFMLPARIKHLHELQNLIYCLTGEELNYTP